MILTIVLVEPKKEACPQSGRVLRKNGNGPSVGGASKPLVPQECAIKDPPSRLNVREDRPRQGSSVKTPDAVSFNNGSPREHMSRLLLLHLVIVISSHAHTSSLCQLGN